MIVAYLYIFKLIINIKDKIGKIHKWTNKIHVAHETVLKAAKRSFEHEEIIEGDIKLDKESAAELVEFYKRNPQYLSLDPNNTEASVS
jgi:adenylate kinase family enzyme